jgi:hypothetical protein
MPNPSDSSAPSHQLYEPIDLIKTKERVANHGEVFTPSWMVEDMLDLVKVECDRIDSRFLEPACGSGNFLKSVLKRKLASVHHRYGKSAFERNHQALFALMCIYGIELLEDNVQECRSNLLKIYSDYLQVKDDDQFCLAARAVLQVNIVQADALTLTTPSGTPIIFPEWGYLGNGMFQRRDFSYDSLTTRSSIEGTLFSMLEEHELFKPVKTYSRMQVGEINK